LPLQHVQNLIGVDGEACWRLARRIVLERFHELGGDDGALHVQINVVHHPIEVVVGGNFPALVWVHAQVYDFGQPQTSERIHPDFQVALCPLLAENIFPVVMPHGDELAVVVEIEKVPSRGLRCLPFEIRQNIVTVKVNLVCRAPAVGAQPLSSRSVTVVSPAAASSVGNQSKPDTISFDHTSGLM